jgi:hypothetical protein
MPFYHLENQNEPTEPRSTSRLSGACREASIDIEEMRSNFAARETDADCGMEDRLDT